MIRWRIVLDGVIAEIDRSRAEAIVAHLQTLLGDTHLTLVRIEPGSVVIVVEGSQEGLAKFAALFRSGQLRDLDGFPIIGGTVADLRNIQGDVRSSVLDPTADAIPMLLQFGRDQPTFRPREPFQLRTAWYPPVTACRESSRCQSALARRTGDEGWHLQLIFAVAVVVVPGVAVAVAVAGAARTAFGGGLSDDLRNTCWTSSWVWHNGCRLPECEGKILLIP